MKFQSLEQFRNDEYGARPGWLLQLAISVLGGVATIGVLLTFVVVGA